MYLASHLVRRWWLAVVLSQVGRVYFKNMFPLGSVVKDYSNYWVSSLKWKFRQKS